MTKQYYGMRVTTILNAAEKLTADLDYLCSLAENPDLEFPIINAIIYSEAVVSLTHQLEYIIEDLAERDLTDDEEYVKLTQEDVAMLNGYTEHTEKALSELEKVCRISLQNN